MAMPMPVFVLLIVAMLVLVLMLVLIGGFGMFIALLVVEYFIPQCVVAFGELIFRDVGGENPSFLGDSIMLWGGIRGELIFGESRVRVRRYGWACKPGFVLLARGDEVLLIANVHF